jgi:hypothetical protein
VLLHILHQRFSVVFIAAVVNDNEFKILKILFQNRIYRSFDVNKFGIVYRHKYGNACFFEHFGGIRNRAKL